MHSATLNVVCIPIPLDGCYVLLVILGDQPDIRRVVGRSDVVKLIMDMRSPGDEIFILGWSVALDAVYRLQLAHYLEMILCVEENPCGSNDCTSIPGSVGPGNRMTPYLDPEDDELEGSCV